MNPRSLALRLRQHHAIEHATVTLLSQRQPGIAIVAHSDLDGFVLYGDTDAALLQTTVAEALARLQGGETRLAIHPNCGTNLATAGILCGAAALLASHDSRRSFWGERLPSAITAALLALFVAAPLGRWLQENVTTASDVCDRGLITVERLDSGPATAYRVRIR